MVDDRCRSSTRLSRIISGELIFCAVGQLWPVRAVPPASPPHREKLVVVPPPLHLHYSTMKRRTIILFRIIIISARILFLSGLFSLILIGKFGGSSSVMALLSSRLHHHLRPSSRTLSITFIHRDHYYYGRRPTTSVNNIASWRLFSSSNANSKPASPFGNFTIMRSFTASTSSSSSDPTNDTNNTTSIIEPRPSKQTSNPSVDEDESQSSWSNYERLVRKLYQTNLFNPVKLGLENMNKLHEILGSPMDQVRMIQSLLF